VPLIIESIQLLAWSYILMQVIIVYMIGKIG
jgi:hypothetical protein